jgi:hypothetical protein
MTAGRIVGLVLVIVGIVVLLWGGIFWTRNKTVVDAGPIDIKTQQHEGVAIPPIVGGGLLVLGVVLLVVGGRQHT